jgi:lipopolysaccharide/colanic/teichoic acid biosynthesis glycosyltransferase
MGIGGLLRRLLGNKPAHPPGLHAREGFRVLLARERMRSDRSGAVFSLAAFTFDPPDPRCDELLLAQILHQRLRATDDAGLLPDGRIAALLPETPPHGAWLLVDEICLRLEQAGRRARCQVFAYPPLGKCHDDPASHDRNADVNGDGGEDDPPANSSGGAFPGERRNARRTNAHSRANSGRAVEPLEALLAQSLPPWKRALDVLGASLLLMAAAPVMLAAATAVKLTSPGPMLFAQRRDGLGGRPFVMYKFRTMTVDAEARQAQLRPLSEQDGPAFKLTNDPRVTRVGRLLRITSIDELPQLWNVLRGEMSLVGPRPLPCDESAACERWQRRRLDVTPGLTCIWQVAGRSLVSFAEWVRMDLQYIRHRAPLVDLKLLMLTLPALLLRRGK